MKKAFPWLASHVVLLTLLFVGTTIPPALGQSGDPRLAPRSTPLSRIPALHVPTLDNAALAREELSRRRPGLAPRFAESIPVDADPTKDGAWESLSNGEEVWRLRVESPGAYSLNLGFSEFYLPLGATMMMYTPDESEVLGPFTPADNAPHDQLWTPIIGGDALILELRLLSNSRGALRLRLSAINHDFMNFAETLASGACNLDVLCGASDGWAIVDRYREQIQSVAMYSLDGASYCTGFLVNNAREDCRPYFATAFHCRVNTSNAPTMVFYWNYRNSVCRRPENPANGGKGDGRLNITSRGAVYRAGYAPTDFVLVELVDPVLPAADAYFAGWNATEQPPRDTVFTVHHPNSEEKRISFSYQSTYRGAWGQGSVEVIEGNHLVVPQWNVGTTEVGSSGAPLFNRFGEAVGQLHGGLAACGNELFDQFGWWHSSWTGGGTPANSLRHWLDPDSSGTLTLRGRSAKGCALVATIDQGEQSICANDTARFTVRLSGEIDGEIALRVERFPPGFTARFSANPALSGQLVELFIVNSGGVDGRYSFQLIAEAGDIRASAEAQIIFAKEPPPVPAPNVPANGVVRVNPYGGLRWEALEGELSYEVELALDSLFQDNPRTYAGLNSNILGNLSLQPYTTYYWRVRAVNVCGASPWSTPVFFTTARVRCESYVARDVPIVISAVGTPTIRSNITVPLPGEVIGLRVGLVDIVHSYVGDLTTSLRSPQGRSIRLFDRIGFPATRFGCDGEDLMLSFSDDAIRTAQQLENTCEPQPAASGSYQPISPFANFLGHPAQGQWTLVISDSNHRDGGQLQAWELDICVAPPRLAALESASDTFATCPGQPLTFAFEVNDGFDGPVMLSGGELPANISLRFSANPARPASVVQVTVEGIDAPGEYPFFIEGSDGEYAARLDVVVDAPDSPPAPRLLTPVNGSGDLPLQHLLTWSASPGASIYELEVAVDSAFQHVTLTASSADTSFILSGLRYETVYYWRIVPRNECAVGAVSAAFSFRTGADLSFFTSAASLSACPNEKAAFRLQIGLGFEGGRLSYQIIPEAPLVLRFDADTTALPGGATINVGLDSLEPTSPGEYRILIAASKDDFFAERELRFLRLSVPAPPTPLLPAPGASVEPMPAFAWAAVPGAESYRFELAYDSLFIGLVEWAMHTDTIYAISGALPTGDYYWRVISRNRCGDGFSPAMRLSVRTSSSRASVAGEVKVYPNPFSNQLWLEWNGPPEGPLLLELFSADGRLLTRSVYERAMPLTPLRFDTYPPGTYLLRVRAGQVLLTRRLFKADW
jgi:subtilisin-like proprotein convertase family protein